MPRLLDHLGSLINYIYGQMSLQRVKKDELGWTWFYLLDDGWSAQGNIGWAELGVSSSVFT